MTFSIVGSMKTQKLSSHLRDKFGKDFSTYVDFCLKNEYNGEEYSEVHHILPRSIFPEFASEPWNLVQLKYADHIEAHTILAETHPIRSFTRPLNFMLRGREEYMKRFSEITKANWAIFKQSEAYQKWYLSRKRYCEKVFVRGGARYQHMVEMSRKGNTEIAKKIKSEKSKAYWGTVDKIEYGKRVSKRYEDPEYRKKIGEGSKRVWPETTVRGKRR